MTELHIDVVGTPAPQGSKRAFVVNGRPVMAESSKKVKPWRQDVKAAALEVIATLPGFQSIEGAVSVTAHFYLPRPQGHYGSGRNAGRLKDSAPAFPAVKPDLDKLLRSTMDALGEAGCWRDDSRVVDVVAAKFYADAGPAGARLIVRPHQATVPVSGDEAVEAGTVHTVQEALL